MENFSEKFDTAFDGYLQGVTALHKKQYEGNNYNANPIVGFDNGKRYIRVVTATCGQRSVHTFIDKTNGDILKAAGWKAPAPNGKRGNIFNDNFGLDCVNYHGANYLR